MYKFVPLEVPSREGLIERVYECLKEDIPLDTVHIPHSDVFFVREALEDRFQRPLSLEQVEEYMYEAGWSDSNSGNNTRESEEYNERAWLEWCEQAEEDSLS